MREAVLGIVTERPAHAHELSLSLRERLPCAEVSALSVHRMLESLEHEGYVEELPVDPTAGPKPHDVHVPYKATLKGIAYLRRWLHSPIPEPILRDELLMRLSVCARDDVTRMIELVDEQEQMCLNQIQDLQFGMDDVNIARPERGTSAEWHKVLRVLARDCELGHWSGRSEWLQSVRSMLELLAGPSAQTRADAPPTD